MQYITKYKSPLGEILISSDTIGITGLWFIGQKYFASHLDSHYEEKETPILKEVKKWLDIYFNGQEPNFKLPLHFIGTSFQKEVWEILYTIPYGKTMSYSSIANIIAKRKGIKKMSAQAIGGAVSKNPISIIIPCHRVVGTKGNLTGYAGGIDKKISLLKLEQSYNEEFYLPKNKKISTHML